MDSVTLGTLYLCATPIGNLEDITLRALKTLKEVDLIAAEDTRRTRRLTSYYGIATPMVSYHEHNQRERAKELIELLKQGKKLALVSDAGMPGVSDPGRELVVRAIAEGIPVVVLPGASAAIAALVISGLPTDSFVFLGFPPRRSADRSRFFEELASEARTMIFYEAPHRVLGCLQDMERAFGPRQAALVRELTKLHEEVLRGSLAEIRSLLTRERIKGEITIVVAGAEKRHGRRTSVSALVNHADLIERVNDMVRDGVSTRDAVKALARERGLPKRLVYSVVSGHVEGVTRDEDGRSTT